VSILFSNGKMDEDKQFFMALQNVFQFRHAKPGCLMMYCWLPATEVFLGKGTSVYMGHNTTEHSVRQGWALQVMRLRHFQTWNFLWEEDKNFCWNCTVPPGFYWTTDVGNMAVREQ
jgi:hypothetical protein